jgi:alkanesulfonate monooxygenase SsuD/methylene tetrahydromethanopterin reductase-like flavin-dependent oxidoreductase (luciferase family)
MLEEALAVVHGVWTEPDGWSFEGEHWQVRGSRRHGEVARDGRRHPHLIIGGEGKPRMARLVARYADEFNLTSASVDTAVGAYERVRAACEAIGRDPRSVVRSAMTGVLVAETEGDLRDRVRLLLEALARPAHEAEAWLAQRRGRWVMGTPDEAHERVAALEAVGVERIMLQDFLPRDLDQVRLMGRLFAA